MGNYVLVSWWRPCLIPDVKSHCRKEYLLIVAANAIAQNAHFLVLPWRPPFPLAEHHFRAAKTRGDIGKDSRNIKFTKTFGHV